MAAIFTELTMHRPGLHHRTTSALYLLALWTAQRPADLEGYGTPMMIGEFGMNWRGGGDPIDYLGRLIDLFYELTSGWMYWSHDIGCWSLVEG